MSLLGLGLTQAPRVCGGFKFQGFGFRMHPGAECEDEGGPGHDVPRARGAHQRRDREREERKEEERRDIQEGDLREVGTPHEDAERMVCVEVWGEG